MLSVASQDVHHYQPAHLQSHIYYGTSPAQVHETIHHSASSFPPMPHRQQPESPVPVSRNMTKGPQCKGDPSPKKVSQEGSALAQALEIARECQDGVIDPTISKMLEDALEKIWAKVQAHPTSYVMSRDEFSIFNYYQHRFTGDSLAIEARRRYWDYTRA